MSLIVSSIIGMAFLAAGYYGAALLGSAGPDRYIIALVGFSFSALTFTVACGARMIADKIDDLGRTLARNAAPPATPPATEAAERPEEFRLKPI